MSELVPWRKEGSTSEEKALLAASSNERPQNADKERLLAALAVGPVGAGAAIVKSTKLVSLVLKALAVAGGASLLVFVVTRLQTTEPVIERQHEVASPRTTEPVVPTITAPPEPTAEPPSVATAVPVAKPAAPASSLAAQIAILDRARAALKAGDANAALTETDRYRKEYPNGELANEAAVLRVQSLDARGDHETAKREARAFVLAHPQSPYTSRMRVLAGDTP